MCPSFRPTVGPSVPLTSLVVTHDSIRGCVRRSVGPSVHPSITRFFGRPKTGKNEFSDDEAGRNWTSHDLFRVYELVNLPPGSSTSNTNASPGLSPGAASTTSSTSHSSNNTNSNNNNNNNSNNTNSSSNSSSVAKNNADRVKRLVKRFVFPRSIR